MTEGRKDDVEGDKHHQLVKGGKGFLWGVLADENGRVPIHDQDNGQDGRDKSSNNVQEITNTGTDVGGGAGTMVVEIPSLSGSSDLSSGAISGLRRALLCADGGLADGLQAAAVGAEVGMGCSSIVSRHVLELSPSLAVRVSSQDCTQRQVTFFVPLSHEGCVQPGPQRT